MKRIIIETFSCLSRFLNVLTGGTADMTFSARSHRDSLQSEEWIDKLFFVLFGEVGHCKNWWDEEVRRASYIVESSMMD